MEDRNREKRKPWDRGRGRIERGRNKKQDDRKKVNRERRTESWRTEKRRLIEDGG